MSRTHVHFGTEPGHLRRNSWATVLLRLDLRQAMQVGRCLPASSGCWPFRAPPSSLHPPLPGPGAGWACLLLGCKRRAVVRGTAAGTLLGTSAARRAAAKLEPAIAWHDCNRPAGTSQRWAGSQGWPAPRLPSLAPHRTKLIGYTSLAIRQVQTWRVTGRHGSWESGRVRVLYHSPSHFGLIGWWPGGRRSGSRETRTGAKAAKMQRLVMKDNVEKWKGHSLGG